MERTRYAVFDVKITVLLLRICGEVGIAYIGRYRVSIHRVPRNIAINPKALTLVRSYHLVITDPLSALLSL
jgi:hypothetical protein